MNLAEPREMLYSTLLAPYGGMTPCRQQCFVSGDFVSRALKVDAPPKLLARHADGFGFYEVMQRRRAVRGSATDAPLYYFMTNTSFLGAIALLRFLIISEVCLMGEKLKHALNVPVSLTATGFVGI